MSIRRNTSYNIAGAIIPLSVTFITLPLYLEAIGEARYGVLAILWTLLGYFGLFDLGLGRAVTNQIAALRNAPSPERERVFWTALLLNLGLGLIGALILWAVGMLVFARFVNVPSALMREVEGALPWMVLAFPMLLTSSVMSGALMGREQFLHQNVVRVVGGVLSQVVPLLVALNVGAQLPKVVVSILAVRLLSNAILFTLCIWRLPVGVVPRPEAARIRPLFSYGGWVTVSSVVAPLLSAVDRIILGGIAGVAVVTAYTIPFNLASRVTVLPGSLSSALFPRWSAQADGESRVLMQRALAGLVILITPVIVCGMLVMRPFLSLWLGGELAEQASVVGEVICIGLWANCLAYIPLARLQAQGRPDLVAKIQLIQVPVTIPLFWVLITFWGVAGAAVAWSLRTGMGASLQFVANGIGAGMLRLLAIPAVFLVATAAIVFGLPSLNFPRLLLSAALVVIIAGWASRQDEFIRHRHILVHILRRMKSRVPQQAGA